MLLQLLSHGQWRPVTEVREALAGQIAPGRAIREYEVKEAGRVAKSGPRRREELPVDVKITSGRASLVGHAVHSMAARYLEFEDRGVINGGKWVRIRPAMLSRVRGDEAQTDDESEPHPAPTPAPVCPQCGLYIVNTAQHEEFHQSNGGPPVAAFFCEEQIRALVADEVAKALDAFQVGLRHYLDVQFAELDRGRRRRTTHGDQRLPSTLQR